MPLRHGKATVVTRAFDELKKFCVTVGQNAFRPVCPG